MAPVSQALTRLLLLVLFAGCIDPSETIVGLPDVEAQSVLLFVDRGDAQPLVIAQDLPLAPQRSLSEADETVLIAVFYPQPLASLRIDPGELMHDESGRPIPQGGRAFVGRIADGTFSDWTEQTDLPLQATGFRFISSSAPLECPTMSSTSFTTDSGYPAIVVLLDGATAFFADMNGNASLYTLADGRRPLDELTQQAQNQQIPLTSHFRTNDGRIFTAGEGGHLAELEWNGGEDLTFRQMWPRTEGEPVISLSGTVTASRYELFGITPTGQVVHWKDGPPVISTLPSRDRRFDRQITYVGPGRAIDVGREGLFEVTVTSSVVTTRPLPITGFIETNALLRHSTLGTLAAAQEFAFSSIFTFSAGEWTERFINVTFGAINTLSEGPDGWIVWANSSGIVSVLRTSGLGCDPIGLAQAPIERADARPDLATAVFADSNDDGDERFYFVTW